MSTKKSPPGALLERYWGALGRSWGRLGAFMGPSLGSLGPPWSNSEASQAIWQRKCEKAKTLKNISRMCLNDFGFGGLLRRVRGHLEPSWGGLGPSWRYVVSHREPTWTSLRHLAGQRKAHRARLEPSWTKSSQGGPRKAKLVQTHCVFSMFLFVQQLEGKT